MKFTLKTQAILAVTALVCVALTVVAALMFPRSTNYGAASMLPAETTVAYAEQFTLDNADMFTGISNTLANIPASNVPSTVAIVQMNSGKLAWVRFNPQDAGNPVTASDNAVLALIGSGTRLSQDDGFRNMYRTRTEGAPWVYVKPVHGADWTTVPLRGLSSPVSVTGNGTEITIAWGRKSGPVYDLASEFPQVMPNPIISAQAGNLRHLLERSSNELAYNTHAAYTSALQAWSQSMFGTDVSPWYDLASLMDGPSSLEIGPTANGTRGVLLGDSKDAQELIAKLHAGFIATVGGFSRMTRTFDDEFTIDTLQPGTGSGELVEEMGGWEIRTQNAGGKTFVSAVHDYMYIISNDAALLKQAIAAPLPTKRIGSDMLIAKGVIDVTAAEKALNDLFPGEPLPIPAQLIRPGVMRWELLNKGQLTTLRLY